MRKRVARYGRVSKKEQAKDKDALTRQLFLLERAVVADGFEPDDDLLFIDIQSGREDDRPEFQKLLALIEANQIDRLYILRVDRISRDLQMNGWLAKLFERTGIELYELRKGRPFDFRNPNDWSEFANASVRSEGESRELSQRIRASVEYARYQKHANASIPWGYVRIENQYRRNPDTLDDAIRTIEILQETRNATEACRVIDRELGKRWTPAGLTRWVLSPVLCGHTPYGRLSYKNKAAQWREIIYHTHSDEKLLSDAQQKQIALSLGTNRQTSKADQNVVYPLRSLLICERCGYRMTLARSTYKGKHYFYAYCRTQQSLIESFPCYQRDAKGIKLPEVEAEVIRQLCEKSIELADYALALNSAEYVNPEKLLLEQHIASLQNMIAQMGDEDGLFARKITQLRTQIKKTQAIPENTELREMLIRVGRKEEYWKQLSPTDLQMAFRLYISKILIRDGQVISIEFRV
jgi:DNA invertase Pin-like site-specific DNA recombinase